MIRNTDVKPGRRRYSSALRDEQAEATRTRILAAMANEFGNEAGRAMIPERLVMVRDYVGRLAPDLPDAELARLADVTLILMSSAGFRAYKDYLGLGPDTSASLVTWAIKTLLEG